MDNMFNYEFIPFCVGFVSLCMFFFVQYFVDIGLSFLWQLYYMPRFVWRPFWYIYLALFLRWIVICFNFFKLYMDCYLHLALIVTLPAIGGLIVNANPWKNAIIPNAWVSWSIPRVSAINIVRKHTTVPVRKIN